MTRLSPREHALTLVELVVAAAILGLIAAALSEAVASGIASWRSGIENAARLDELAQAADYLTDAVRAAQPGRIDAEERFRKGEFAIVKGTPSGGERNLFYFEKDTGLFVLKNWPHAAGRVESGAVILLNRRIEDFSTPPPLELERHPRFASFQLKTKTGEVIRISAYSRPDEDFSYGGGSSPFEEGPTPDTSAETDTRGAR